MAQPTIFQKRCNVCKTLKPWEEFYKHASSLDKLHPSCKTCVIRRSKAWRDIGINKVRSRLTKANYRHSPKGREIAKREAASPRRQEQCRRAGRKHYAKLRARMGLTIRVKMTPEELFLSRRNSTLKRKYKITQTQYETMLDAQGGLCAICLRSPSGKRNDEWLTVDHCHATGAIRGLLCHKCNAGIGMLNDDLTLIESAHQYLQKCA